jgi:hypothetical protein
VLVLDMIEILPPLEKYKYDTWRILPVKCYIDNSVRLWSCIRNVNTRLILPTCWNTTIIMPFLIMKMETGDGVPHPELLLRW